MANRNPYAAPQTDVALGDGEVEEYGEIKVFSASGRLGRLRYIGYTFGVTILIGIVMAVLGGIAAVASPNAALLVVAVGYVAIIAAQFMLTIQRAHDFNTTGWLSLISLIPLAALIFWFVPGTRGENTYGKPPPPNTTGVILLACLLPVVMILGILAAIAIPAYQDYTLRAQVSEGLNLAAPAKAAVAETYLRTRSAPADRLAAGMSAAATDTSGKYVESVDVENGTIIVTYGGEANGMIAGSMLALQPYVVGDDSVVWRCGHGAAPGGAVEMDSNAPTASLVTDLEPRHLPSACRP
jgi:type IV pilus assembly protein PilA